MANRYVDVQITRETKPMTEQGFGMPLILSTEGDFPYTVYTDYETFVEDFTTDTATGRLGARMFGQNPRPSEIALLGVAHDSSTQSPSVLTGALAELQRSNDSFYYVVSNTTAEGDIRALADYMETQDKLYGVTTPNVSLAEEMSTQYNNTFLLVHDNENAYIAEGLISTLAPRVIGSYTWTFKNVSGAPAAGYGSAEISRIHAANASTYINEAGVLLNSHGVVTSGEYIDVIQATHFLKARMAEYVFRTLAMTDKVPFTNSGISLIVAEVENVLDRAFAQGIIAEENGEPLYSVTFPSRTDVPANDRANRRLPNIEWRAVIAGAIESVEIRGVLAI